MASTLSLVKGKCASHKKHNKLNKSYLIKLALCNIKLPCFSTSSSLSIKIASQLESMDSASCRICLNIAHLDLRLVPLEDFVPELPHTTWLEMFQKVSGFDVSDLDPKCICSFCATELVNAFSFLTKLKLTEEALISYRANKSFDINLNAISGNDALSGGDTIIEYLNDDGDQIIAAENKETHVIDVVEDVDSEDEAITAMELAVITQQKGFNCFLAGCKQNYKTLKLLHEHVRTGHEVMMCPLCQFWMAPNTYPNHLKVSIIHGLFQYAN